MFRIELTIRPSFGAGVTYALVSAHEGRVRISRQGLVWPTSPDEITEREGNLDLRSLARERRVNRIVGYGAVQEILDAATRADALA